MCDHESVARLEAKLANPVFTYLLSVASTKWQEGRALSAFEEKAKQSQHPFLSSADRQCLLDSYPLPLLCRLQLKKAALFCSMRMQLRSKLANCAQMAAIHP